MLDTFIKMNDLIAEIRIQKALQLFYIFCKNTYRKKLMIFSLFIFNVQIYRMFYKICISFKERNKIIIKFVLIYIWVIYMVYESSVSKYDK